MIDHRKVLILALNGPAVGGGAAWFPGIADIVLASSSAWLQCPFSGYEVTRTKWLLPLKAVAYGTSHKWYFRSCDMAFGGSRHVHSLYKNLC